MIATQLSLATIICGICEICVTFDDSEVLIEAEDRAGEQERLRHIIEQPCRHIVDLNHLISHQRDTAHDEQHRTGILRDLETFCVLNGE